MRGEFIMAVKTTYYKSFDGFFFELTEFSSSARCSIYDKDGKFKEFVEGKDRHEVSETILSCMTYDAYFFDDEILHGINSYSDFKHYMKTGKMPEAKPIEVPKTVKEDKSVIKTEEDVHNAFAEINRLAEEEANRIEKKLQTEKADREAKAKQDILSSKEAARLVAEEVSFITGEPVATPVEKKSEVEDEDETKISTDEYAMPDLTDFTIF